MLPTSRGSPSLYSSSTMSLSRSSSNGDGNSRVENSLPVAIPRSAPNSPLPRELPPTSATTSASSPLKPLSRHKILDGGVNAKSMISRSPFAQNVSAPTSPLRDCGNRLSLRSAVAVATAGAVFSPLRGSLQELASDYTVSGTSAAEFRDTVGALRSTITELERDAARQRTEVAAMECELSESKEMLSEVAELLEEADEMRQHLDAQRIVNSELTELRERNAVLELQHEEDTKLIDEYAAALQEVIGYIPDTEDILTVVNNSPPSESESASASASASASDDEPHPPSKAATHDKDISDSIRAALTAAATSQIRLPTRNSVAGSAVVVEETISAIPHDQLRSALRWSFAHMKGIADSLYALQTQRRIESAGADGDKENIRPGTNSVGARTAPGPPSSSASSSARAKGDKL